MNLVKTYDAIIIGGGFFGCKIALYLKKYLKSILILEKEKDILTRASYANQARVHKGYHYPRSFLTAWRSQLNFPKFIHEYQDCIYSEFTNYYAISKLFSKINANQFRNFCDRVDIFLTPADISIKKMFNNNLIEEVFRTQEYTFNILKIRDRINEELEKASIEVGLGREVIEVKSKPEPEYVELIFNSQTGTEKLLAKYIFNCTYSGLNNVLVNSHLPTIPLKHELAEIALVEVPSILKNVGITLMCGPFFSLMPFPARSLHSLTHVRYTPLCYWQDTENSISNTKEMYRQITPNTSYPYMIRDAARYLPIFQESNYVESLWELKTVLPQSEVDDSRPILFKRNQVIPNLISVLGGKIDNIYDIPNELKFIENGSL